MVEILNSGGSVTINNIYYENSIEVCARGGAPYGHLNGYSDSKCNDFKINGIDNILIVACGSMDATRNDAGDWHKGSIKVYGGIDKTYPIIGSLSTFIKRDGSTTLSLVETKDIIGIEAIGWCTSGLLMLVGLNVEVKEPQQPLFEVVDFKVLDTTPAPHYIGDTISLMVIVQNVGDAIGDGIIDILRVKDGSCITCNKHIYDINPGGTTSFEYNWVIDDPLEGLGIGEKIFAQVRGGAGMELTLDILYPGQEPPPEISKVNFVAILLVALAGGYLLSRPKEVTTDKKQPTPW